MTISFVSRSFSRSQATSRPEETGCSEETSNASCNCADNTTCHVGNRVETQSILHPGVLCDACGEQVDSLRFKCLNCVDFDLCAACEKFARWLHPVHTFAKIHNSRIVPNEILQRHVVVDSAFNRSPSVYKT